MLPLMSHQKGDVDWIHEVYRGLLGNEPGLGKSRSAIEATRGMKTLVIAPAMVLAGGVWDTEIGKWAENPGDFTLAAYTSLNTRRATGRTSKTGNAIWEMTDKPKPEYKGPWDAVILDEAHYIKGRATVWTKAAQKISLTASLVMPMTGTPVPNWSYELFTVLQLLHPAEAKPGGEFGSFWRWAEKWFDTTPTRFSRGAPAVGGLLDCVAKCQRRPPTDPCEHYIKFASENLGPKYRRVWRSEVLDLPPSTEQVIQTPMTATQRKIYRELKRDFIAQHDGQDIIAWNQGALNVMLEKVTTSHTLLTGRHYHPKEVLGTKLEQLKADLAQRSRATLVVAHYADSVRACHEVALEAGLRSGYVHGGMGSQRAGAAVRAFIDGELDVLVGSIETIAEGQTLTVADMAIMVESSWKSYRNEQVRFRIDRIGQERPVTVRYYVTPDSVDERKRRIVGEKTDDQIRTMSAAEFAKLA